MARGRTVRPGEGNPILIILGAIAIVAHLLTLYQFIVGNIVFDYWDIRWIAGILFLIILLAAGLALVRRGTGGSDGVTAFFGLAYMAVSLVIYIQMALTQTSETPYNWSDFFGMASLFLISYLVGYFSLATTSLQYSRIAAYLYGATALVYTIALANKYIFERASFESGVFGGELVLLILGFSIFGVLFNRRLERTVY